MTRARAALIGLTLLVGCGPASPGPSTAGTVTAPPATSAATAAPTSTAPAAGAERFEFGTDAVVDTLLAGTTDKYVNPGAVIEADGVLHMFPNLFSEWPGRMRIPHLTSDDGLTWTLDLDAPVIDSEDVEFASPGMDVSTGYLAEDGTWVLYIETVATAPWQVHRATAPSPQGPWTFSDEPVLTPGAAGSFDDRGITWPSVIRIGDRWAMYYAGITGTGRGTGSIGVAFSDDGITWERQAEPVLVASERWELKSVDRPRVVQTPSGLVMVYAGLELTSRGVATSTDGVAWSKVPGPAIDRAAFPVQGGAWDAALLYRGGELEYFLEIGTSTTKVYRATLAWPRL
jgi:predicted GH43/DUF377 family glycosyl hydrolase